MAGPVLTKAKWYARRLRSMSAGEVLHRIGEQVKRLPWRRYDDGFAAFTVGDGDLPIIPGLRDKLTGAASPELEASFTREALQARTAPFSFLGTIWPDALRDERGVPVAGAWLLDPVTGKPWEGVEAYCFNVPYRTRPDRGDVKLVWEVNRLQFLQSVAVHGARTGDSAATAAWVVAVIRSWMDANPPFRGINWCSGIELALRIVSVSIAASALGAEAFTREERALLRTFLNAHAFWLNRFESAYSSANNHLTLESLGLLIVGLLCPDLPGAVGWEAKGRATLEREVSLQILDDGVGAEQSPTYTSFTVEAYLLTMLVANAAGRPLSDAIGPRLALAGTWLRWLMDEGGHVPEIGDNDAGRIVALPQEPERDYVASVLSATAAMTGDPDIAPPRNPHHLRDLLFGHPPHRMPGPTGLRIFRVGGYSVWRGLLAQRKAVLVFDHGPLGFLSIAAHGHADTLSVWLHLDGRSVLVDAGTYLYFGDPPWREYARSTAAHNTLGIPSRSSSQTAGPFNWRQKATGRLVEHSSGDEGVSLIGEHDGYLDDFGFTHRRVVEVVPMRSLIRITDSIVGETEIEVEIAMSLAPDLVISPESGFLVADSDGDLLRISGPAGLASDIVIGREEPHGGWMSPEFGSRLPAARLQWSGKLTAGHSATTTLEIL